MDDGKLANEMTLEGIAKELKAISRKVSSLNEKVSSLDGKVTSLDGKVTSIDDRMTAGFASVGEQLNGAKIRDEELHSLMKFGLEAREALRESVEAGFKAVDKKQDEEIGLVKDVVRGLAEARR